MACGCVWARNEANLLFGSPNSASSSVCGERRTGGWTLKDGSESPLYGGVMMAGNKRLFVYLAILGLIASRSFALPGSVGGVVRLSVATVGVAVLVGAVVLRRPKYRAGWWLVALSAVWSFPVVFGVVAVDGGALSRVSQLVLVILGLVGLAAGLGVLGWESAGRRLWNALDASMTALGACLVGWVFFVEPSPARSLSADSASIATAALLVFALAMMLALGGAMSTWSGRMLLLASAVALCTSALVYFGRIEAQAVRIGPPIVAAYLAQTTLLGGAGIARDFVDVVGDRRPAPDVPRWRLVLFAVLALLAPLDVAVDFARSGGSPPRIVAVLVPFLYATLILLLLVVRLALVARVASARAAQVGHQSASLARAMAEQGELQRELAYRALHDPLTGVANRHVLIDRLDRLCKNPCNVGQALIMLDLDGFKDINDTFGHPAGDQILVDVVHRLVSAIPEQAVLVRLGGDEFAVLMENTPGDEARRVASTVVEGLRSPFVVAGREVFVSASAGLVVTERGAYPPSADEGLRDVDQALYAAKEGGRNRVAECYPRLLDERLATPG